MRVRLKHVQAVKRGGKTHYYHRKTREKLPADPDERAKRVLEINGELAKAAREPATPAGGTFAALIAAYRASPDYQGKAAETKRHYNQVLRWFEDHYSDQAVAELDNEFVWELRDAFADKPRKADYFVQVLSVLCSFALRRSRTYGLHHNPCRGVKRLAKGGEGIPPWPDDVIAAALEHAYPELLWAIAMGLYLGQRGQDDVKLTWRHYDGERIWLRQCKTGKDVGVPVHPTLKVILDSMPRRGLVILTTRTGRPWTVHHIRHELNRLMHEIGHPGYSRHGLRKNAVNSLAEAGCSPQQIQAITGQSLQMVEYYAQGAQQRRLADEAMRKLIENGHRR